MHRPALFAAILALPAAAFSVSAQSTPTSLASPPGASAAAAAPPPEQAALLKSTEAFLRNLFAWGSDAKVDLGPVQSSPSPDFYTLPVRITMNGQTDAGSVYVSKDGKTVFRGDMYSVSSDPYAEDRNKIHLDGNPSRGPVDARVVVVEYSDFECPHCRQLYEALKTVEPEYPQVRFVFKDFPLTQIHPWAETAAIGARCAYMQSPSAFWKVHDAIFEEQELISPENIWDKLVSYGSNAGLDAAAFKSCLASDEAKAAVEANRNEGVALGVESTPTVYVNGRPDVGGDKGLLEQFIKFELAQHPQ
jgi:protein-disulfide isomerase